MLKARKLMTSQGARAILGCALAGTAAAALTLGLAWAQTCPPTLKYSRLYEFSTSKSGQSPVSGVVLDTSGTLYGVSRANADGFNVQVYKLTPPATTGAWTETALFQFGPASSVNSGSTVAPYGKLAFDANGALYGTVSVTSPYPPRNVVYQLTPPAVAGQPWTEADIYTYTGAAPLGLTLGPNGALYGVTYYSGNGTVLQLTPPSTPGQPWTGTTIYTFQGGSDGSYPASSLVFDTAGALYGATVDGGGGICHGGGCGTVFKLTPTGVAGQPWTKTTLYSFQGNGDGQGPTAIIFGARGALYGTTYGPGSYSCDSASASCGNVFQLTPPATAGGHGQRPCCTTSRAAQMAGVPPVPSLLARTAIFMAPPF